MYQNILVPLDGSKLAEVALPYAEELSGRLGSEITLIYITKSSDDPNKHIHQFYLQNMAETVKEAAQLCSQKSSGKREIQVKTAIIAGNPAEKIVDYADKNDIGLIVMSTHGRSGITRWTLGSVADKVVRATRKPVELIRAKDARPDITEKGLLKKMLVPLDGSSEGEVAIPYVEELASKLKAQVTVLQVLAMGYLAITTGEYIAYTQQQIESDKASAKEYLDKVSGWLKKKGVTVESQVRLRAGSAAEDIIILADEIHADLVVMSTHGRSGVGRWVLGSVAEKVLHEGNTPLLLVRSPKA